MRVQAARHRLRVSEPFGPHRIRVPFTVRPSAPLGEQNAPGCTPFCTDGAVVLTGVGFGFGLGAVVRGGLVVFRAAGVREGVGFAAALVVVTADGLGAAVGLAVSSAPPSFRASTVADMAGAAAGFGFGSVSLTAPTMPPPQQHRTNSEARVTPMVCLVVKGFLTRPSVLLVVVGGDGPIRRTSVR